MNQLNRQTFVGFGLGAIQTGLFLYEAQSSGNFDRLVVAEVVPETVQQVRDNHGFVTVNIAHADHIEAVQVGPVELLNPAVEDDRRVLIEAVAAAQELCTAVPSVNFYNSPPGPSSICQILAVGLAEKARRGGPRAVIYTAENHNHAAEILSEQVLAFIPAEIRPAVSGKVRFLNTVIGKMSGVISDPAEVQAMHMRTMIPGGKRAILVEAFNHILISRIQFDLPAFERGITAFIEKDDLLPFEEAKLYGHNATHALGTYLGALLGLQRISELSGVAGMMDYLREAFIDESGAALISRYHAIDPLFTPAGYAAYADDLLARMVNPYLFDAVERVGRDPERKLGWDDRLIGTMRLALAAGIRPLHYAVGAAAAVVYLEPGYLAGGQDLDKRLRGLWGSHAGDPLADEILQLIREALPQLPRIRDTIQRVQ